MIENPLMMRIVIRLGPDDLIVDDLVAVKEIIAPGTE
jgi:hypothetical protein